MSTTGSGNQYPRYFEYCKFCGKRGVYKSGYIQNDDEIVKYEKCRYCEYIHELK